MIRPDGTQDTTLVCARPRWVRVPPEPTYQTLPQVFFDFEGVPYRYDRFLSVEYPMFIFEPAVPCPADIPRPTRPPVVDTMTNWLVQRFLPAVPAAIPPGFALAGLPATLRVGGPTAPLYEWIETVITPQGAVIVNLEAVLEIQWGDGTTSSHEQIQSASTASSTASLSHTYTEDASVQIMISRRWSGYWQTVDGTVQGVFTDELVTETVLPLEVRSVEARRAE